GRLPARGHESLVLEAIERRVERALVEPKHALRSLLEPFRDSPAVHGAQLERLEDEHVEGSLEDIVGRGGHDVPFDSRKENMGRSFEGRKGGGERWTGGPERR